MVIIVLINNKIIYYKLLKYPDLLDLTFYLLVIIGSFFNSVVIQEQRKLESMSIAISQKECSYFKIMQ